MPNEKTRKCRDLSGGVNVRRAPESQANRGKVQFWVPPSKLGDLEAWREAAREDGVELGPWLHKAANLALKMRGVLR